MEDFATGEKRQGKDRGKKGEGMKVKRDKGKSCREVKRMEREKRKRCKWD